MSECFIAINNSRSVEVEISTLPKLKLAIALPIPRDLRDLGFQGQASSRGLMGCDAMFYCCGR